MNVSFDDLNGKVCAITGGGGVIGRSLSRGLSGLGVKMAILDLKKDLADEAAADISRESGHPAVGVEANVLNEESLKTARDTIHGEFGPVDILINCAGGNHPQATTGVEMMDKDNKSDLSQTFFGLDIDAFRKVFDLNFLGTLLPTMVLGQDMVDRERGTVLNISSMNSYKPLTKIPAYSAAKASINNFTEWLATHLAQLNIRVNAIAPGFFLTSQNRFLLTEEKTGELTPRGHKIINGTPMGKFGQPEDLNGAAAYLVSDISSFVTGIVIPIDGGYNAYSGV